MLYDSLRVPQSISCLMPLALARHIEEAHPLRVADQLVGDAVVGPLPVAIHAANALSKYSLAEAQRRGRLGQNPASLRGASRVWHPSRPREEEWSWRVVDLTLGCLWVAASILK